MKKLILILTVLNFTTSVNAENWIPEYGFFENQNEIFAKNNIRLVVDNIFDYENSPNAGGKSISQGRYYIETKYHGGYNGTDADYIYLDEVFYDDTEVWNQIEQLVDQTFYNNQQFNTLNVNNQQVTNNTQQINQNTQNINISKQAIQNNSNRLDEHNKRIHKLEEKQYIVGAEIRLYDSRKWQINTFADYSTNRNMIDRTGIRFTYKMGKSYEEKKLEELESKLNKLMNN